MKKYTHAWLALKAVQLLESYVDKFDTPRREHLKDLLKFISRYPATFARGAWMADNVVKDNTEGGHTWKYYPDEANGRIERRHPPGHNNCLQLVANNLNQKVSLDTKHSALADRCEALSQTIRDMVLITRKVPVGDVVAFNNSQIALTLLMLSHYICDAHVPVHCDKRDFNKPSKIHNHLEGYWESEVKNNCHISIQKEQFDLDESGHVHVLGDKTAYDATLLGQTEKVLAKSRWQITDPTATKWQTLLGKDNNNFWDYTVSVCLVSFQMSQCLFPPDPPPGVDYDTVSIMQTSPFKESVIEHSPKILADAINSTALLWLAAWERWKLLEKASQ